MAVGFASYEIARSGLRVSERGLAVTGHNIANVNTPGYVRQQAMITTSDYQVQGNYQLGLGATIQEVRQIRHMFLDNVYRSENQALGYWEARSRTFEDIQAIMGEPMEKGLQDAINQFWDSWHELSKNPDSLTTRAVVRQRGEAFTRFINHIGSQLDRLQENIDSEIVVRVDEINSITRRIRDLNLEIVKAENFGDNANDLNDQRNLLIDRLSKIINVEIQETGDGQINVLAGGYVLVSKGLVNEIYAGESEPGQIFMAPKLRGTDAIIPLKSGILKGLIESRGDVSGAKGSEENGSPYDKIDLVFAIDTSDSLEGDIAQIRDNIDSIISRYKDKGIDVRLGIVRFDNMGSTAPVFYSSDVSDVDLFKSELDDIIALDDSAIGDRMSLDALNQTTGINYRANALRHVVLLTDANANDLSYSVTETGRQLRDNNITVDVITSSGTVQNQLGAIASNTGGNLYDKADGIENDILAISDSLKEQIYGNIHEGLDIVSSVKNQLNLLINVIAREINSLHRKGYTLDGNPGVDFFVAIDPMYAMEMGNIKLNPLLSDLDNIVASGSMVKGDNTIALEITKLRDVAMFGNQPSLMSINDFYQAIILGIGTGGEEATRILSDQQKLLATAENYRNSISGVSMDEEMANMLKYQFAYSASARVIGVIDEMMQTIISRLGIVR